MSEFRQCKDNVLHSAVWSWTWSCPLQQQLQLFKRVTWVDSVHSPVSVWCKYAYIIIIYEVHKKRRPAHCVLLDCLMRHVKSLFDEIFITVTCFHLSWSSLFIPFLWKAELTSKLAKLRSSTGDWSKLVNTCLVRYYFSQPPPYL